MATFDPTKAAAKWARNLQAASQDMQDGVNAVTTAPGVKAAAKQATMKARLIAAIDSGKWARNTAAVPLSDWQHAMITKGIPHAQDGAAKGQSKMVAFLQQLQPQITALKAKIDQMPNVTPQDRKNRMVAWFDGASAFTRSR